jgi:hypothetical protein
MAKFITIGFFCAAVLVACRKEKKPVFDGVNCTGNCYILTGTLVDSVVNTGIAEGEMKFYFRDNTGTFSSKTVYLGKATTGTNGSYTFRFDGSSFNNRWGYYYAEAYNGNMFSDPVYQNRVGVFYLDTSMYNIPLVQYFTLFRPATLKVRVIASAVTNFQYLTVDYNYGKAGKGIIFNGGRTIDTVITWKTAGDLRSFVQADAVGNGVNIQKRDTVVVPANGTRQVEIRL